MSATNEQRAAGVSLNENVRCIIRAIGDDPEREGLIDTPGRVIKSWQKLYGGYGADIAAILKTSFGGDGYDQMVTLGPIEFFSTCEHHMIPFFGTATVAYIPGSEGRVVGISKLARVVDAFSRRLQIQERMTYEIADAIEEHLLPAGVAVLVRAQHLCMVARGVEKREPWMITTAMLGNFRNDPKTRAEFMSIATGAYK